MAQYHVTYEDIPVEIVLASVAMFTGVAIAAVVIDPPVAVPVAKNNQCVI